MQREEKQLEASLDALLSQVADLKNSLGSFIYKLENEYDRLTWPSVLDSFALLSGQLNTLNKVLKHEKTPLFRNQVIIPLVLSPDRDEDLMRQTEGRVPVFSHEVVPNHLRTKPDPEVEEQEKQLTTDAARIGADAAQKQIQSLNKMCSNLLEKISKEERESESGGLRPNKQTFNPNDTNALAAAVAFGKGLSNWRSSGSSGPGQPGQPGAGTILAGASGLQQVQMAGAPSQQQPMLSGVQMAQAGQPVAEINGQTLIKTIWENAKWDKNQHQVGFNASLSALVALYTFACFSKFSPWTPDDTHSVLALAGYHGWSRPWLRPIGQTLSGYEYLYAVPPSRQPHAFPAVSSDMQND
ncbi:Mediator of RNA polymerase II transcription subunit 8 [Tupaia chinensis]|uniref:Mediator of RNA polymerase II transcription subunit 8 n=1 Tax=Tupaia chinensis TaxID=246437 RepID=L9KHE3_TUPCH|nr:Mediator of RNA polymerase II transcription subunit 8 [Tupaia chinensis]